MEIYLVYGITDCPACLRACADLMERDKEYVFIETDFSKTYRNSLKEEFDWDTFPMIVKVTDIGESFVGGYDQLFIEK
jgi:glutaredoxin-related protein